MLKRPVNVGFSGGEKRLETLQMAVLKPQLAILGRSRLGLDIYALNVVHDGVSGPALALTGKRSLLVITHYINGCSIILCPTLNWRVFADGHIVNPGGKPWL